MRDAILSDCGFYRWRLERHIGEGVTAAVFGVNPSTADASLDDATVRKWRGFGLRLGWGRLIVGNVFSYRATDVKRLALPGLDPFGPDHQRHLGAIISDADILVPCWGDRGKIPRALRIHMDDLLSLLGDSGKPVYCWGKTAGGDPRHPLMLGYATPLIPFGPQSHDH